MEGHTDNITDLLNYHRRKNLPARRWGFEYHLSYTSPSGANPNVEGSCGGVKSSRAEISIDGSGNIRRSRRWTNRIRYHLPVGCVVQGYEHTCINGAGNNGGRIQRVELEHARLPISAETEEAGRPALCSLIHEDWPGGPGTQHQVFQVSQVSPLRSEIRSNPDFEVVRDVINARYDDVIAVCGINVPSGRRSDVRRQRQRNPVRTRRTNAAYKG